MSQPDNPLSRRDFLKIAWPVSGAVALGESLFISLRFLAPRENSDPFGGPVSAGPVEDFPPGSVTPFDKGRFFLVRGQDGGFLALYRQCPHLGCTVRHQPQNAEFQCACHASAFGLDGEVLNPPATRPLDLFPVTIANGIVVVNTTKVIQRSRAGAGDAVFPGG